MKFKRSAGTLVHPTSFPTRYGIGDLGHSAKHFLQFLAETDQFVWQILPLGPTGYGNSPYASYSAFAGNHYLISPDVLADKGLLDRAGLSRIAIPMGTEVPYERAFDLKDKLFTQASEAYYSTQSATEKKAFTAFKKANSYWLDDYALFMACSEYYGKQPWNVWDEDIRKRTKDGIKNWSKKLKDKVNYHLWLQYEFFNQWNDLKAFANSLGIQVVGDIPIFVDHNSSDVWSHPEFFEVNEAGDRLLVAGVPPDYFSETGQLWGNPLYRWKELEKDGFSWWVERFRQMFHLFDAIRVDHFRGFDAYWEINAAEKTAMNGRWVKGPGMKLFDAILQKLGDLPIIAEDLGVLTESVIELRDKFAFPGMKILQFGFADNAGNSFLPHNFETSNCIVYTGTHDNDTTLGWYAQGTSLEKHRVREYTRTSGATINWELIRLGMLSNAVMSIFPLQDFMNLGTEHRMNYPGTSSGNWKWRYTPEMLENVDKVLIKHMIAISNRDVKNQASDANIVTLITEDAN
jgi:4-alpha-glucanotransferase